MGYALYFLDRDGEALRFFERALEKKPGDEDAIARLEAARRGVTLPIFLKPFRNRVKLVWRCFSEEASIVMDLLTENWSLKLGRGPGIQVGSGAFRSGIRPDELTLWVDQEDSGWRVSLYAESFRGISEDDAQAIFEDLGTMIEDAVGEAVSMRYVCGISIMKTKRGDPGIRMNELARWFHEHVPMSAGFDMRLVLREKLEFWLKPDPRPLMPSRGLAPQRASLPLNSRQIWIERHGTKRSAAPSRISKPRWRSFLRKAWSAVKRSRRTAPMSR